MHGVARKTAGEAQEEGRETPRGLELVRSRAAKGEDGDRNRERRPSVAISTIADPVD